MNLDRALRMAGIVGIAGLAIAALGAMIDPQQFYRSYLIAYLFWISFALGCLSLLMLHDLVGGRWGVAIRQFLQSGASTIPIMAVFVIPILIGIPALYEWSHADVVAHDRVLQEKSSYLNIPFFIGRTIGYFVLWFLLTLAIRRWHDRGRAVSGPAIILFTFATTFAAVDWVMSLEPHWFSTIYGAIFVVGQALQTAAFCVGLLALMGDREPFSGRIDADLFHDLGNLLLAFTCLWAYTSFSQFLIIWSGNIPEETPWYLRRTNNGWQVVSAALMLFHFGLPFAILLSRNVKRRARTLAWVAGLIIVMRMVDLAYWVEPAFEHQNLALIWIRIAAAIGLGGVWIAAFLWFLRRTPLLDVSDPRIAPREAH
jgi:hypothetical protein